MDERQPRIAVGLDRSPAAHVALTWAVRLASVWHATVLVVTAWPDADRAVARAVGALPSGRRRLHRMQRDAIAAAGSGLHPLPLVVREIVFAEPEVALCHAGNGADLLVIGASRPQPVPLAAVLLDKLAAQRALRGSAARLVVIPADSSPDGSPTACGPTTTGPATTGAERVALGAAV
ncbi:universal stress protein [Solwaraspora sp. WMMB335]|uniref:universal stress protein n=1 Tax=Solwaraspora sp. WMMB335 TaxID=3404118 RepID=UPI003B940134